MFVRHARANDSNDKGFLQELFNVFILDKCSCLVLKKHPDQFFRGRFRPSKQSLQGNAMRK